MQVFDVPGTSTHDDAIALSPDGQMIALVRDDRIVLLDTHDGSVRPETGAAEGSHTRKGGLAFTADGRALIACRLSTATRSFVAGVRDLETGEFTRELPVRELYAYAPEAHGRGLYLACGPLWEESEITRWDTKSGKRSAAFRGYTALQRLTASADGKWLAGASYQAQRVRVWKLGGKKFPQRPSYQLRTRSADGLALSSDGAFLAAGETFGDGQLRLFRVRTGESWEAGQQHRHTHSLAFHPSRPLLVHVTAASDVAFYDVTARAELKRFAWGVGQITAVCFSPDGLRCAAAGAGKVVVWDVDV